MSAPQIAISRWMEGLSIGTFRSDLERCLVYVDQHQKSVPSVFIDALVAAEDHRSEYHRGVDPIGMLRALWIQVVSGHVQGASTIEQQFVRVVTGHYERTISRKVREQLLAIALVRHRAKESIASAYLAVAFYGSGCIGLEGLNAKFGPHLDRVGEHQALRFVSQLKYPRPLQPSVLWYNKINARTEALWKHRVPAANEVVAAAFDPRGMAQNR
jgi:monofunctional glycosyltransferase